MSPHMSSQYGELRPTSGRDLLASLRQRHPANFNGFRVLAALLHSTLVVGVSQTLWHGTRNGITELSQRAPPIFGWAAITLGIGPHSSRLLKCTYVHFVTGALKTWTCLRFTAISHLKVNLLWTKEKTNLFKVRCVWATAVRTVVLSAVGFVAVITTLWVSITQLTCRNTQSVTDTAEHVACTRCIHSIQTEVLAN